MKLVKEHINEKFTNDESDPIRDLGIGLEEHIRYCWKQAQKLTKKNKNIINWFIYESARDPLEIVVEIKFKNKKMEEALIKYLKSILIKSGLNEYVNDEIEYNTYNIEKYGEISWITKQKYIKHFKKLYDEQQSN